MPQIEERQTKLYNCQNKNRDLQNITQNIKARATRTSLNQKPG